MRRLLLAATLLAALPAHAQDKNAALARILDEGTNRSQVMVTAQHLTDVIGARLPNSPSMRRAEDYAVKRFADWGLKNARKEGFDFGRGWSIERSSVRMVAPRPIQLTAIPIAWTPATNGALTASVIVAPIRRERDFAKWRGKLAGKIVMVSQPTDPRDSTEPAFRRFTGEDIAKLDQFQQPTYDPEAADRRMKRLGWAKQLDAFLKAEGAVAQATMSRRDGKLLHGEGYLYRRGDTPALPGIEIAAEDYRRLARLAKSGTAPALEIVSDVRFHDDDLQAYNILAEIPGTDPKAGYVMAGAHYDSWVGGDGAVDNAAGSAMVMEAGRILAAMGVRPRRTIRFALWNAEEQGLLGSFAYVDRYLAARGRPGDPPLQGDALYYGWSQRWPVTPRPGFADLAAYFNIDNGSGKLRGIYAEGNLAAVPTFREWLSPLSSLGASAVVAQRTGGTDHLYFQQIGLPGFQFVQDPLDYGTRAHHSNVDTFDRLKPEDMRQGAMVLAHVLLSAANAERPLPRPPVPTQPVVTSPFAYSENDDD